MDLKTIYTKTAKGLTQVNQKTQSMPRDLMKVLKAVDGKSDFSALLKKLDADPGPLEKVLNQLKKDGFVKIFEVKQEDPLSDFGGDDDFDFTAPGKLATAAPGFGPSPFRPPASADQVERAVPAPAPAPAPPAAPDNSAELEAALAAARAKAKAEAQARAEREAQIRARLEVEAKARKEAELRALEEAKRTQQAAEKARADLESRLADEAKQRAAMADSRAQMTRDQLANQEEQQRALAAARARAEAEAQALSEARARAEAEAKSLAMARVQAEEVARKQLVELESAQRDLRQQLKAEIEAKVRAEMQELLKADVDEGARAEIEAAVMEEARDQARHMLEEQLQAEREMMARAGADATRRAEEAAQRMLAEQEVRIRAEMEARMQQLTEEKNRAEIEARKMAEAQAEAASRAAAELSERLKAEEQARKAAQAEAELRRQQEASNRVRLEARAREEAEDRARADAEMRAKLAAEKEAKIQAQARLLIESEMREKSDRENQQKYEVERRAREEAEKKASLETRAREVASRAVAEQVAKREELERLAEARIAQERALREKAEEKSQADERAEADMRAAQVARLKELQEQAEQKKQEEASNAGKPKKRGPKKERHVVRWLVFSVVAVIGLAIFLIHAVPLGAVNVRLEKALAAWIHDDVSSSGLRVSLFPRPHVKLDQVALGKVLDAKALSGRLYMDMNALYGDRFAVDTMELNDVTIATEALPRALAWANAEGRGKTIEIENILLRNAKVDFKGIAIEPFDADIKFDKAGKIVRVDMRSRDGKWTFTTFPDKTDPAAIAAGTWVVDFNSRGMNLPMGMPVPFGSLKARGSWTGEEMVFPQVEATLFEGSATGNLRVDWKQGVAFATEFSVQKMRLDDLAAVFSKDVSPSGRLEGSFSAAGSAATIAGLMDKLTMQGNFLVKDGTITNVDLVQAMRSPGSVGGQTKFTEFAGQFRLADGILHYEKIRLAGGVLLAGGNINVVYSTGAMSGTLSTELKSSVAQDRAVFSFGGTVARPALRRGG
jgi:hypothetical protein